MLKTVVETNYKKDEKKDFTPEEFAKAKTVCDFIIELTKAISRSGYYDADHPVSLEVKKGLYDDFNKALGDSSELMLTSQEYDEKVDIHISGVLNEPFNIRKLTHANTSDLFVPKLKDYFERKSLNSFVIKKYITAEHFEAFIDIMSEPVADSTDPSRLGEYLTKSLAEHDITEVSTVFKTDVILLRGRLPWRVSIILRRLAKDLKVVPLFRSASVEKMKEIKRQIVEDIIRPLNNTDLLRDLIVNCDVIVSHLTELMEVDELENLIISSLPQDLILPVSEVVLDVYREIRESSSADEDEAARRARVQYLDKVLKIAAQRILSEKLSGTEGLFEQLYELKIVDFQMLPEKLRHDIQSRMLAGDVISKIDTYIEKIESVSTEDEAGSLVTTLKRVMPELIRRQEWPVIKRTAEALGGLFSRAEKDLNAPVIILKLPDLVFEGTEEIFADAFIRSEVEARSEISDIFMMMRSMCINIAGIILNRSKEPDVIKSVIEFLSRKGKMARDWSLKIIEDPNQPLSLLNIALIVIVRVGMESDAKTIRKYTRHPNVSIRTKALAAIAKLNSKEAESSVLDALADQEEKVRSQAVNLIERELTLSTESTVKVLELVKERMQKKNITTGEAGFFSALIRAAGKTAEGAKREILENEMIGIASDLLKERSGLLKFIKSDLGKEQMEIVSACLAVLGKAGGQKSGEFLKPLSRGDGLLSKAAGEALAELEKKQPRA